MNQKERSKEFIQKVNIITQIIEIAINDISLCADKIKEDEVNEQFWRRTYIRTLFSLFEGIIHMLRQLAIEPLYEGEEIGLSHYEICALKGEAYKISGNGKVVLKSYYTTISKGIMLINRCLRKRNIIKEKIDPYGQAWEDFNHAIRIRNRITHPKVEDDLRITEEEFESFQSVTKWFIKLINEYLLGITLKNTSPQKETSDPPFIKNI